MRVIQVLRIISRLANYFTAHRGLHLLRCGSTPNLKSEQNTRLCFVRRCANPTRSGLKQANPCVAKSHLTHAPILFTLDKDDDSARQTNRAESIREERSRQTGVVNLVAARSGATLPVDRSFYVSQLRRFAKPFPVSGPAPACRRRARRGRGRLRGWLRCARTSRTRRGCAASWPRGGRTGA